MSLIALVACITFIVWLIKKDSALRGPSPGISWVPFLWLLVLSSRPVSAWFGAGGSSAMEGSPIDAGFAFTLYAASAFILIQRGAPLGSFLSVNTAFVILLAYFAISCFWAPYPFITFKRWSKEIGNILIALVIITERNPAYSLRHMCVRCGYILLPLSVILIRYFPKFGRSYSIGGGTMVTGVTQQKNTLGLTCAILMLVLIWDMIETMRERRVKLFSRSLLPQWITLLIGSYLLFESESKTSLLALIAGLVALLSTKSNFVRRSPAFFAHSFYLVVSCLLVVSALWTIALAPVLAAIGRDPTLTDRTRIWNTVLEQVQNPLLGSGFYSFWLDRGPYIVDTRIRQAHNGYLEMYLDGGIIGISLVLIFIFCTLFRLAGCFSSESAFSRIAYGIFVMTLLTNFSETYMFRWDNLWFLTVMVAFIPKSMCVDNPERRPPIDEIHSIPEENYK